MVWKYLLRPAQPYEKLDLTASYVSVGAYTIQDNVVYGAEPNREAGTEEMLELLKRVPGVLVDITYTGKRAGNGHGTETVTLVNGDGTLILKAWHVDHCDGPGHSCVYSHGPWYKYGSYNGTASPDTELIEALEVKQYLARKFRF